MTTSPIENLRLKLKAFHNRDSWRMSASSKEAVKLGVGIACLVFILVLLAIVWFANPWLGALYTAVIVLWILYPSIRTTYKAWVSR